MLKRKYGQIDIFNQMMFDSLVPKDHLLVKIDSIIDFSFAYDIVKDEYSDKGRGSCNPVIMTKLCLFEFLYTLSDRKVRERAQTDIAFRWFLGLNLDDLLPDDTTISLFLRRFNKGKQFFWNKRVYNSDDVKSITCPNGNTTNDYTVTFDKTKDMELRTFKFSNEDCAKCPLREACVDKTKSGKIRSKHKTLRLTRRHDAMYLDLKRTETNEFKIAMNKRYIVERRFATLVRNHGLHRCRYRKLPRAIIHITPANTACNIIRMIKLLFRPSVCAT